MKKLFLVIALIISYQMLLAQILLNNADAGSLGKANAGITSASVFSVFLNQAAMTQHTKAALGIAVRNNYLLQELNQSSLAAILPTKFGVIGASLSLSGFELYKEYTAGFAYALNISEKFALGSKIEYLHLMQQEYYGYTSVLYGELSLIGQISEKLTVGAHIFNPTASTFNDLAKTKLPIKETIGICYKFSPEFAFFLEQNSNFETNTIRIAGEYQFKKLFTIRAGTQIFDKRVVFNAGTGFVFQHLILDIAFESSQLTENNNLTSAISISYLF
jgi:long-subunit fatty acid transport protein